MASVLMTIGVLGALLGGGFLLMKAPTVSSVSRETMIDNIKDEYSTFEDFENAANSEIVEEKKDVFSVPLGVDSKKTRLDMLLSDVSSGIKNNSSNDEDEEKSKKKVNGSLFRSFLSFLFKIKELLFLLVVLLLLLLSSRKSSKNKK